MLRDFEVDLRRNGGIISKMYFNMSHEKLSTDGGFALNKRAESACAGIKE